MHNYLHNSKIGCILDKTTPRKGASSLKIGDLIYLSMSKIQRISDLHHQISFLNPSENFDAYFQSFLQSDLGKIYLAIPWNELVAVFNIKESIKGSNNYFSPRGK